MGKSKDLATGASAFYQDQTESDARYVNVSGDTMTGDLSVTGDLFVTNSTNAKLSISDNISEVGSGNLALQAQNSASSALKPMGFRAEDFRYAIGSNEVMKIDSSGRVTKPSNPCAAWGSTGTSNLPQDSTWRDLNLNYEVFDKNNNYDTSTKRFTAPVSGVYLVGFSGEFTSSSNTTWSYLCPRINGSNTANLNNKGNYFADFATAGNYVVHSQTWFLNLAANDYFVFSHIGTNGNISVKSYQECQFFATLLG